MTPLKFNNEIAKVKHSAKYLGLTLDSKLLFREHIKSIMTKSYAVTKNLYSLKAKNSKISNKNKRLIYKAIIRPIITYAAPIWKTTANTNLLKLQRFQNKCLRLITNKNRYTKIKDLHSEAEIEYLGDYIDCLAKTFYNTQLKNNPLLNNLMQEHLSAMKD